MPVVSIRFAEDRHHQHLKTAAERAGVGMSPLAEELIEEGLRMREHPQIVFRSGPSGRRPALALGPDVAEVIGMVSGGDVLAAERRARAADLLALPIAAVDAALAYYADHTDEVDADIQRREAAADEHEARWRRSRELLDR